MTAVALDVDAVRARFSALRTPTALFDAPGGTQVPDSVIDAIAGYLRESNANLGGAFGSSRRTDALLAQARLAAAAFLRCEPDETIFGANMTTLNFALTRALGRTLRKGDEILVTKLDHDGNVAPWLELAHDLELEVGFVEVADDTSLDYDDLERKLTDRTRVVAFTARLECGRNADRRAAHRRARARGRRPHLDRRRPLRAARADRRRASCRQTFSSARRTSSSARISGSRPFAPTWRPRWRTYKVRPATHPFETGTLAHELLAGFIAAVDYIDSIGWQAIQARERELGQQFLDGLPDRCTLYGLPTMEGRVPTFAFNVDGQSPRAVAERLAERDIAVWDGDYYAVEIMQRLGLGADGAVRAGFVHYNTAAEVDRLLAALEAL